MGNVSGAQRVGQLYTVEAEATGTGSGAADSATANLVTAGGLPVGTEAVQWRAAAKCRKLW